MVLHPAGAYRDGTGGGETHGDSSCHADVPASKFVQRCRDRLLRCRDAEMRRCKDRLRGWRCEDRKSVPALPETSVRQRLRTEYI